MMCALAFWASDRQKVLSWGVFLVSPGLAVFWSMYWLRQKNKKSFIKSWIPKNQLRTYYVTITLMVMVALYAAAYKAAGKLGGALVQHPSGKEIAARQTYEYLHFSLTTATTLGDSSIFAEGKARILVGLQTIHFWILVVTMGILTVCPRIESCPYRDD